MSEAGPGLAKAGRPKGLRPATKASAKRLPTKLQDQPADSREGRPADRPKGLQSVTGLRRVTAVILPREAESDGT